MLPWYIRKSIDLYPSIGFSISFFASQTSNASASASAMDAMDAMVDTTAAADISCVWGVVYV